MADEQKPKGQWGENAEQVDNLRREEEIKLLEKEQRDVKRVKEFMQETSGIGTWEEAKAYLLAEAPKFEAQGKPRKALAYRGLAAIIEPFHAWLIAEGERGTKLYDPTKQEHNIFEGVNMVLALLWMQVVTFMTKPGKDPGMSGFMLMDDLRDAVFEVLEASMKGQKAMEKAGHRHVTFDELTETGFDTVPRDKKFDA